MAINEKDIVTEITLELDRKEISVNDFRKAIDGFLGLVKEVTKASCPKKDASAWLVQVYPGSAGIGLSRKPGSFTNEEVSFVERNIKDGLSQLEIGQRHNYFSDKAIEHIRKLGDLFKDSSMPAKVRIWGKLGNSSLDVTKQMSVTATYLLEAAYEDDGSVDGILEKLNGHGHLEFVIYDLIYKRPITCEVAQDKLGEAWKSFLKRVEVVGKVRYRRDGMPVSVKATEIIPFPSKNEIPDLETMRSLLGRN